MTEQTREPERNQAGIRDENVVPLEEGAVRNAGAFMGGESPADAEDDPSEDSQPLDSRTHFGGDGAQYVDPALDDAQGSGGARPSHGTAPGDDGYDAQAGAAPNQNA